MAAEPPDFYDPPDNIPQEFKYLGWCWWGEPGDKGFQAMHLYDFMGESLPQLMSIGFHLEEGV